MIINLLATWIPALGIAFFGRTEAHGQSEGCRGDAEGRSRTLSSTARCDGDCIRGAVRRASHDETRVYSRVLLLRRCDRDRAVARRAGPLPLREPRPLR